MSTVSQLHEKLRKIETLFAGAGTAGERLASERGRSTVDPRSGSGAIDPGQANASRCRLMKVWTVIGGSPVMRSMTSLVPAKTPSR
jgi:hypothetical protein